MKIDNRVLKKQCTAPPSLETSAAHLLTTDARRSPLDRCRWCQVTVNALLVIHHTLVLLWVKAAASHRLGIRWYIVGY